MESADIAAALGAINQQLGNISLAVKALQDNQAELQAGQARVNRVLKTTPAARLTTSATPPRYRGTGPADHPEPRVPLPEKFNGDRSQYRTFITSCQVLFSLQPRTYSTDFVRVRTLIALLSGEPQLWAHQLLLSNSPALASWNAFFQAMNAIYDDPLRTSTAHASLRALKQNKREVEDYIADFRRLSVDSTWNEPALLDQFRQGLSEAIKDELVRVDFPSSLEEAMHLCVRIDRRIRERRRERAATSSPPRRRPPLFPAIPARAASSTEEPMQLGAARGPLPDAERRRRQSLGLCWYCGKAGHLARGCPRRPPTQGGKRPEGPSFVLSSTAGAPSHLLIPVFLQWDGVNLPLQAMIDSGASGNFLDAQVAQALAVPLQPKTTPIPIQLIDGTPIKSGPVISETKPLRLQLGPDHREMISFDIVASPLFPLVLGLPWLRRHNPAIDWSSGVLRFASPFCLAECFLRTQGAINSLAPVRVPTWYQDYSDVFEKKGADILPPHREYDCPIDLVPGAPIPYGRIYPLSEPELRTLKEYLEENIRKGFIRPSSSPAGAGIFFVPKKDGGLRPCVDYRAMNAVTVKNKYPLPLISELLDRLREASVFTKLDLRGAYNLVRVKSGHEWKTAFRTRYGHYEYLVMPFGLCNAPATFQHFINDIFRDVLDVFVVAYLDDILVYSTSLTEHRVHVREVLQRLRQHSLYAKLEKCIFEVQEVEFLGYVLSPREVRMDRKKVEAILSWPTPKTRRDVQSFLGFSNFYRRFVRNFSQEVRPLTALTKTGLKFLWSEAAQKAFGRLKECFTSAPVLTLPDPQAPYFLEVDASEVAAGAVLSQRQGPREVLHPVAFFSKAFSPAERNYDVSDRELLAVKLALEEWRHLLEGAAFPVTVMTDHKNLEYLQRAKRLKARQARWSIFFTRFNLHITYRPGSKNGKADALSRINQGSAAPAIETETILPPRFFMATHSTLWEKIRQGTTSLSPAEILPSMTKSQGLLLYQGRIVVPRGVIPLVLQVCHDSPLAGHGGHQKTKDLVQRTFWWRKMNEDVINYVTACAICNRAKDVRAKAQGLLQPLSVPSRAWTEIAMDFIVELPRSEGCDTVLVVVDRLTKMGHFIALQGLPSAKETAEAFVREVVRLHGLPETITTDRGSQFTSKFWEALCKSLHIQRNLSTAFHPRTNGQTERTNQTLEQYLRCYIAQAQESWRQFLPLAEFAFNNQVHRSTGLSPFYANYGYHPHLLPGSPLPCNTPGVEELLSQLSVNYQRLKETLSRAQEDYKRYFDARHTPAPVYQVGDKVWLSTAHIKLALPSKKLGPRVIGPFSITRVVSPTAMQLQLPESYRIHPVFHVSLLRPVVPDPFPYRTFQATPNPVLVDGEEEYEVQNILDSRRHYNTLQYLVSWKGYGPEENSWIPASEVHAPARVRAFHLLHPQKPSAMPSHARRGRPRLANANGSGSVPANPSTMPPSATPSAQQVVPRPPVLSTPLPQRPRRGRPRKDRSTTPGLSVSPVPRTSLSHSQPRPAMLDSSPNAIPRPRRGRPRKDRSTTPGLSVSPVPRTSLSYSLPRPSSLDRSSTAMPRPRRGRPRKTLPNTAPMPRPRRGRPRKTLPNTAPTSRPRKGRSRETSPVQGLSPERGSGEPPDSP